MVNKLKTYFRHQKFLLKEKKARKTVGSLFNAFDEQQAIFVHIPKTAGMSIVQALFKTTGGHRSALFLKQIFSSDFDSYFKFTFIRNPWDRLYSAYRFLAKGGINEHDRNVFEKHLKQCDSFEDFVLNYLTRKQVLDLIHFQPQSKFLMDESNNIMVDFIGRYENLEKDFLHITRQLNTKVGLPHINKTIGNVDYRSVYTDEMKKRVAEVYQDDIKLFNYTF